LVEGVVAVNLVEVLGAAEEATQDRITIYIPSRDRDGKPVDFESWVVRALELLSRVGGGATRMPPACFVGADVAARPLT